MMKLVMFMLKIMQATEFLVMHLVIRILAIAFVVLFIAFVVLFVVHILFLAFVLRILRVQDVRVVRIHQTCSFFLALDFSKIAFIHLRQT